MTERWVVHHADVLDALTKLPDSHWDACLSDVPYGLGPRQPSVEELIAYLSGAELNTGGDFMSNRWFVPSVRVWREIFRVLKPGSYVLAFAGARTVDLIMLGMRAAGFEIRDTIQWIHAEGMPHSVDISKAIDEKVGAKREVIGPDPYASRRNKTSAKFQNTYGEFEAIDRTCPITAPATEEAKRWKGYGTGLRPSFEPVILARKPLVGTLVRNVLECGVGGLAIDACRLEYADESDRASLAAGVEAIRQRGGSRANSWKNSSDLSGANPASPLGRWPANVCFDEAAAAMLDAQSGNRPGMSGGGKHSAEYEGGMFGVIDSTQTARGDSGGASRFFYVAKASREERELGCEHLPIRTPSETVKRKKGSAGLQSGRAGAGRSSDVHNYGPCVKPVDFTRWLATLVKPPPRHDGGLRKIGVPYAGTGSEMMGALLAGWDFVEGIECEPRPGVTNAPDYLAILKARVHLAATNPRAFEPVAKRPREKVDERQIQLFGGAP